MRTYPLAGAVVVATSAVRESRNREEFLTIVKRDVGFEIEILSGEEEARRTLLGIESGLPAEVDSFLGIDIGGGSTEFMRAENTRSSVYPEVFSLEVGVVRLTEREFHTDGPPSEQAVSAAERIIQTELDKIGPALGNVSGVTLIGTAGTITTLAAMAQKITHYESARIHNYRLPSRKFRSWRENYEFEPDQSEETYPDLNKGVKT